MKVLKLALCAAVASFAMAGAAAAQDAPTTTASFNFGVSSDYVFRGISQTDENPQFFGGADVVSGILYAGIWASNIDFGDETNVEYDLYAGVTPTLGPITTNFGVIYYGYMNAPDEPEYDYWEFRAGGSMPVGPATVGLNTFYSPEFFGETGEAWYTELSGSFSPMESLTLGGAVGHQDVELVEGYTTWNLGGTYAFADNFTFDVRYHDTDIDECDLCDERIVATLKATFP
jgi:uncharacterized protein (TIGR02001 family)